MRVWILGAGNLGVLVADHFVREMHDVVIIERNHGAAGEAMRKVDCNVEICDATDLAALRRLAIDRADCFVAATSSDEVNMVVSGLVAQAFHIPIKIARVRNRSYATGISGEPELFGIDHVLNPEVETATTILRALEYGTLGQIDALHRTSYTMREVQVSPGGGLDGQLVSNLRGKEQARFIAPILARGRENLIVKGSTLLRAGDTLYVFSDADAYHNLVERDGGKPPEKQGRVLILGGSLIGITLAQALESYEGRGDANTKDSFVSRMMRQVKRQISNQVTILEPSETRCEEISHLLPGADVIAGDIRDDSRFSEADYRRHDMVIGVGANQEANIVGALHAKAKGVKRAAAVLEDDNYARIARNLGVDLPVSMSSCTVSAIASHLRGDVVKALYTVAGTSISIVEVVLAERSAYNGVTVREAAFPRETLILLIARGTELIIPDGNELMHAGDVLLALTPRRYEGVLIHLIRAKRQRSRTRANP